MPSNLYIDLPNTRCAPGETISGKVLWALDKQPGIVRLTFGWWTEGRGTRDSRIETSKEWETDSTAGEETFQFPVPPSPYSFSGTLITLKWALELSTKKGRETTVEEILVSPREELIELPQLDEGGKKPFSFISSS